MGAATRVWLRIGLLSFGGPAGQIALMHRLLVDERRWIGEQPFLHALNFCMLLPGPEAQQLATCIGWRLHGIRSGRVAGVLFIVPGMLVMLALSIIYAHFHATAYVHWVFIGIKAAALVVIVEALLRVGKRVTRSRLHAAIGVGAFIELFAFNTPFPLVIAAAGVLGYFVSSQSEVHPQVGDGNLNPPAISMRQSLITLVLGLALWCAPIVLAAWWFSADHMRVEIGVFFSKLAIVTFGGAYAVLAYMGQEAVSVHGWLSAGEMVDGLGLAESTPGPLIMVTQFVAFLGGFREAAPFSPLTGALLASAMAVWTTFVPCFLWIFLGAPHIERLRSNVRLSSAMAAITAAVVGVIANLALWFAMNVLFGRVETLERGALALPVPVFSTLEPVTLCLTAVAALALLKLLMSVVTTLMVCATASVVWSGLA
jgi:chromate transporter